jgi:hypothetical protein
MYLANEVELLVTRASRESGRLIGAVIHGHAFAIFAASPGQVAASQSLIYRAPKHFPWAISLRRRCPVINILHWSMF